MCAAIASRQHVKALRRRIPERAYLGRGFAGHAPPHVTGEQPRVELAGAETGFRPVEFESVYRLNGVVVRLEEPGRHVIRPVRRARQHQRPRVAGDACAGAVPAFDDAVVGELSDRGDDGGPVHAEAFGQYRWLGSLDPIGQSPLEMRAHMKPTICSVMGSPLLRSGSQLMSNGVLRVMMPDFWLGALLCSCWLPSVIESVEYGKGVGIRRILYNLQSA